jgi:hypothetical protein
MSAAAGGDDDCDFPDTPPPPGAPPGGSAHSSRAISFDPNDIVGPAGVGDLRYIRADRIAPYTIHFENAPKLATAPAQEVVVTQSLDPDLDWRTFELGDFGFGSAVVKVPAGLQAFQTTVDYQNTDGTPLQVAVSGALNRETGIVTWSFRSVDPATGRLPDDVLAGFLPVNDGSHRGEGFVSYDVTPKSTLVSGTSIDQQASIVFDLNAPIVTNTFSNTIDATPPTSAVQPLPAATNRLVFPVAWTGDDSNEAGVATYDLYVSDNGGPFTLLLDDTPVTRTLFTGTAGHDYRFYTVASDNLGVEEATPPVADQTVSIHPANTVGTNKTKTFTDVDGDKLTIKFKGPGDLTYGVIGGGENGAIDFVQLDGSTEKSKLIINVRKSGAGDGAADIGGVLVNGSLGLLHAKKSDLVAEGILATGLVKSIAIRDVLSGVEHPTIQLGGAPSEKTNLSARVLGGDFVLHTPGIFSKIRVAELGAGSVVASEIGKLQVAAGTVGNGGITGTVVNARTIASIQVESSVDNATILAGAALGEDHAIGGTGSNADAFGPGSIGKVRINGDVRGSTIAAGLSTTDAIFKNDDDIILGGDASVIAQLAIAGNATQDNYFAAHAFPTSPKIDGQKIEPASDRRFLVG